MLLEKLYIIIVIVKMIEQSCNNILNSVEIPDLEEALHVIEGRDFETLVVASIGTLKHNNKNAVNRKFFI